MAAPIGDMLASKRQTGLHQSGFSNVDTLLWSSAKSPMMSPSQLMLTSYSVMPNQGKIRISYSIKAKPSWNLGKSVTDDAKQGNPSGYAEIIDPIYITLVPSQSYSPMRP